MKEKIKKITLYFILTNVCGKPGGNVSFVCCIFDSKPANDNHIATCVQSYRQKQVVSFNDGVHTVADVSFCPWAVSNLNIFLHHLSRYLQAALQAAFRQCRLRSKQ